MPARSLRYASEFGDSGYSVAARRCIDAMVSSGIDVAWEPLHDVPVRGRVRSAVAESAPTWMRALRSMHAPGENLVLHSVPRSWSELVGELHPGHVVGHSVWECETLPTSWLRQMDVADEFWVPTRWNKEVFERSFSRPVHVVPHVVSTDLPEPPPLDIADDVVVFVTVSAWDWRKRPDRVVEAYLNAFTSKDPVVLVVKTTPNVVGWDVTSGNPVEQIHRIVSRYPRAPTVIIDTGSWSDGQVLGLLKRADCFVSMTASEGWALGAFDAACMATPVLITGWGGHTEWLGADHPGFIEFSMVENDHPDREVFESGMKWAYADMSCMVDRMRAVATGGERELIDHTLTFAPRLRERCSVEAVGQAIADALANVDDRPVGRRHLVRHNDPVESVLVLTPVKNAARHAHGYVDRILALDRPAGGLSVAILVSDSIDDSADIFDSEFDRLRSVGIGARVFREDFGYVIPPGTERWDPAIQLERRRILALSRNHLLFAALGREDWVLWLDADVVDYPPNLVSTLAGIGADIVQPDCVRTPGGPSFDLNAWTDRGRWHLDSYRGFATVDLHAVGGTVLLVRADRHRDGLVWPAFLYGNDHPRKRLTPDQLGRPEVGEIETEGLAMMAHDMGVACVGLPDVQVIHE